MALSGVLDHPECARGDTADGPFDVGRSPLSRTWRPEGGPIGRCRRLYLRSDSRGPRRGIGVWTVASTRVTLVGEAPHGCVGSARLREVRILSRRL